MQRELLMSLLKDKMKVVAGHTDLEKGSEVHTDLSVTGWNIQALKAAALTGIPIEGLDEAMDKAVAYTKRCQDKTGKCI